MNKKIICISIVSMFLLTGYATIGVSAKTLSSLNDGDGDNLDQKNTEIFDGIYGVGVGGRFKMSQSFKPTYNIITRIYLRKGGSSGSCGGNPRMNELALREELDGNNIAYISKKIDLKPSTMYDWVEFDIPDTAIEPEKTYYIVWGTMEFYCDIGWFATGFNYEGDPYSRGEAIKNKDGEWKYYSYAKDMHFKTYGRNGDDGNHAPDEFELITSTTEGKNDQDFTFQFRTNDVDNDKIKYRIKLRTKPTLGDYEKPEETITELFNPSEINTINLNIDNPSVYWMTVTALDEHNAESPNSIEIGPIYVSDYQNSAPNKPILSGKKYGHPLKSYEYSATTWDCDKDQVWYMFDWGDETKTNWLGPYDTGETCMASHRWLIRDIYNVRVKSRDSNLMESDWSDPLSVFIKNKAVNTPFLNFLQQHPLIFQLIQRFLNL